ncbi:unnamed protein product [Mucor circinelloides]|uniref:UBX domain-containing protein n=1 Tax=Mucor circinelloides f. circinelloides (strain 1006PhL) TaxID=1220926 RepID=S2JFS3_MUCC1|nr:hypothetical protein HMPREF1544_11937 [Mucor circinelloides 1006PhL]
MSEQDILNFCEITGATTSDARNFLEIADNNVSQAIDLYLVSREGGGSHQPVSTETSSSSRAESTHSDNGNFMTDEEIARQMQEQENEVRAPIAPKTDILAGGSTSDLYSSPMWPRRDNAGVSRPSVFNQGDSATGSVTDFLSRLQSDVPNRSSSGSPSESLGSPASAKARRLADLFRPPFDMMFRGTFEEAREAAKEKNRWLMINVQDPTEFSCQVLNRDLWSDSIVKDIVKESFIFLQYNNGSPEGARYNTFYSVNAYPHLAIVDARTGERIKVWEKALSPTDFMMDVTEFMEQNSPDSPAAAVPKRPKKAKNFSDMSEEEQLNAAIAASLDGPSDDTASASPDISEMDIEPKHSTKDKGKSSERMAVDVDSEQKDDSEEELKAGSAFDGIKAVKRDETTDMANATRIQLRMGDGSRIIRRFLKTEPVQHIFEFVKAEVPDASNQQFELVFNRMQLIDVLDQTIEEAGLANAAVNCVFV